MTAVEMLDPPMVAASDDLARAVDAAMRRYTPLRASKPRLEVRSEGSAIHLTGNVRSETLKSLADQLAARVPGVTSVVNELVSDDSLEREIALQLATDDVTSSFTDQLRLKSLNGLVYLGGAIARESMADAEAAVERALEIARGVDGVRGVVGTLRAVEGSAEDAFASAPAVMEDEPSEQVQYAKAGGSLIPDERKAKIRGMIAARAEDRKANSGD